MSLFNSQKQPNQQIVRTVSYPYRYHTVHTAQPASGSRFSKVLAFFVMATLLITAGFIFGIPTKSGGEKTANSSETQIEETKPEPPKKLDFTTMNAAINAEIVRYPNMDIGVSVIDIMTGDSQEYGVQVPFLAASTAKMLTAIAFLQNVEQGKNTLTQQVGGRSAQAALEALIVESDNAAWYDFNTGIMSHAELNAVAESVGLTKYNPENNTIIPSDVAKLLNALYQEKLINHENTQLLLSYMARAKEVDFVTNTVPAGIKVYHKPGYLADRVHDAVIIDNGKRPYVLVIFSKSRTSSYNRTQGEVLFKNVTLATLTVFNQ
jgi:beta-lactamase class A